MHAGGDLQFSSKPEPPAVTLVEAVGNSMHLEALEPQREAVEGLLARAVGAPVRVTLSGGATGVLRQVRRLSEAESRAERLRVLRGRDPALGAAADGLDLEVLE